MATKKALPAKIPAKKTGPQRSRAPGGRLRTAARAAVTKNQVRAELLAVWDADTWLHLWQLEQAEQKGSTLNDIGIRPIEAESYVNKYNSIIVRSASAPAIVKPSEAAGWVVKKMSWIIDEVFKRSQA